MSYFEYGETETSYLKDVCPKMAAVIAEKGMLKRKIEPDLFRALISSIVSQQISTKAAVTVFSRLQQLVRDIKPAVILGFSDDDIKACGLSYRKVGYIRGICEAVFHKMLDLDEISSKCDEDVIGELLKLNGIGRWSAEMFLIFSLARQDVLSFGDLGIRNGLMKLHGLEVLSKETFETYRQLYSPYGTVASFYLWEVAGDA